MRLLRKPTTPEQVYWTSVVPLGGFLVIGGAVITIAVLFYAVPIMWIPFVESASLKRLVMALLGIVHMLFGAGLLAKSRPAWIALFFYLILGTTWIIVGALLDPYAGDEPDTTYVILALLLNGPVILGIYLITRPVFKRPTHSSA